MPTFYLRVKVDVPDTAAEEIREDQGLPSDAPVLPAVRQEVWDAVAGVGAETGRWTNVQVT